MRLETAPRFLHVAALVALNLLASTRSAQSSGINSTVDYSTTGSIAAAGSGTPIVSFQGVDNGTLSLASPGFNLGQFMVAPLPAGASLTLDGTPFDIRFTATGADGTSSGDGTTVDLKGTLGGTIAGGVPSTLFVVMDDAIRPAIYPPVTIFPSFQVGNLSGTFDDAPGGIVALLVGPSGGSTSLGARLQSLSTVPRPAPEPASIAVFGGVVGLLGWRWARQARARRRA